MMESKQELVTERYKLSMERISAIIGEETVQAPFRQYFEKVAAFILYIDKEILGANTEAEDLKVLEQKNQALYQDILPKNYEESYGNPTYAVKKLGEIHGRILSFLYTEIRSMIAYAYEGRVFELTILVELFIEIYNCFEEEELPVYRKIQQIIYWFVSDYSELFVTDRVTDSLDASRDFATKIVMESDLTDVRYLYGYGEYVSENEIKMARYLNSKSEEEIVKLASVITEGFRRGYEILSDKLSQKNTINIRYSLGFESIVRKVIENFREMGLEPVIYREAVNVVNKIGHHIGYHSTIPNHQFFFDHKGDASIYMDKLFVERKLGVLKSAYEQNSQLAKKYAGPCCIETFGEEPFVPEVKKEAYHLSEKQQELSVYYANESSDISNQYIKGEEYSFTIIAFPVPAIGEQFTEIFDEVVKINTLDYEKYQKIQQCLIDALDTGYAVRIQGQGNNRTNLVVALQEIRDESRETKFENCVADVNIPVGEVFTSPKLTGTKGCLHVEKVFLNGLQYRNLELKFADGMITEYQCDNGNDAGEGKKFIKENLLNHHKTLPLGEFAIGTNTTAYMAAQKYGLQDKFPILIAEKMGPHFAVGDTCYSRSEDVKVYNPDGKEIIARENEVSCLRKEKPQEAYFNCHTDITIPYDELGIVEVLKRDGSSQTLIREGKFVLSGTEDLNLPFQNEN